MRSHLWVSAFAFLIATPAIVRAQAVTGSLEGRVVSADSEPLDLAVVTASGPFLQGTRAVTTDASGRFQIQALPPGRYELRIVHIGHQPLVIQQVVVELGQATGLATVTMNARPVELEPIAVTAQAISLDPVHTTVGGTLDAADYASLPVDRNYASLITVLPHANESVKGDPVNVGGSTGLENQYYIDGVNVTDPKLGARATSLPYNFVRAVEVKTGGYEAQYGRALGAIVNAITYTGTNDFEVNLFGFVQPSALALDPRVAPVITEGRAISYDFGARVGGPIVRDRLWYSAALNPRVDRVEKEMAPFGLFPEQYTALRFAGKLTWQASSSTGLELSFFGDPTSWQAIDAPVMGTTTVLNPDAYRNRRHIGGVVGALRATLTPSPTVLLETAISGQRNRNDIEGETARGRSEGLYIDRVTLSAGGGYFQHQREEQDRVDVMARGTFALGRHTVVAGVEYGDTRIANVSGSNGVGVVERWATGYTAQWTSMDARFSNRIPAAYLQDAWRLSDRLMLNAGLRWSGQFITNGSGRVVQEFTDQWQPRAGFSWQVGRLGSQRLFGSYSRVFEVLPSNLAVVNFVDAPWTYSYYSTDPRQPGAVPDSVADFPTVEPDGLVSTQGAQLDNFDEYTLGYERLLGGAARFTLRGIYRHLRAAYLNACDPTLWRCVYGTPGQGDFNFLPAAQRQYSALEVALDGAWHGLRYRASYVLSRTWGNYTGLFSSDRDDEEGFNPGANATFSLPEQVPNSTGLLPNDRTHVIKASAAYAIGSGLEGGVSLSAGSGSPLNEFAAGTVWSYNNPVFLVPRGTAGRASFLWNVDLRLAYTLPNQGGVRTRVLLDVLHLGNPRTATRLDEYHYLTLDQNNPSSTYMQPVMYQPPMGARLGVEVSF